MSVLQRWGRARRDAEAVVFVTRNLVPDELASLYNEIDDDIGDRLPDRVIVLPCDEQGVSPGFSWLTPSVEGLPSYFFGIRPWLRRRLAEHYRCSRVAESSPQMQRILETLAAEIERESQVLMQLDALRRTIEDSGASPEVVTETDRLITIHREQLRSFLMRAHKSANLANGRTVRGAR